MQRIGLPAPWNQPPSCAQQRNGRMGVPSQLVSRPVLAALVVSASWAFSTGVFAQTECSLVKTNRSCTYTVDRSLPLTPPTIQMYSGQTVTVAIKNAYSFESYSLDWSSGLLNPKPDVGSSVFAALQPSLKNLELISHNITTFLDLNLAPAPAALACTPATVNTAVANHTLTAAYASEIISACFAQMQPLQTNANQFYAQLQVAIWPDSITPVANPAVADIALQPTGTSNDADWEEAMVCELFGADPPLSGARPLSGSIAQVLNSPGRPPLDCATIAHPPRFFNLYNKLFEISSAIGALNAAVNPAAGPIFPDQDVLDNLQLLVDSRALIDSTRTDLTGYGNRLVGLVAMPPGHANGVGQVPVVNATKTQIPSVTYNVNALNLVLNPSTTTDNTKKKLVVAITIVYGDARWEASAGTFFSNIPVRSFSASPVFQAGSPDTVIDKKVAENDVRPLVIPFGAVNYRLSHDLNKPQWRENWYWSWAVGINPNTVTSDFATGLSWSYRALMFSGFWHIGHDVKLTQSVKVGDSLGASFSASLPTQNYWRFDSFGIGISIRTPSLTGR